MSNEFIEEMKIFQNNLLDFLDTDDASKENYENIQKFCKSPKNGYKEKQLLLIFIERVIHNHHHTPNFLDKVLQITEIIFPTLLGHPEIFSIFKNDKILLLKLYEQRKKNFKYCESIQEIYNEKRKFYEYLNKEDKQIIKNHCCENDSLICELIRNDSIEEFIIYVNKNNIQLNNCKISESIFETNSFLFGKSPTLIEYAAFFGSIQIFNYLNVNNVELTPSLWLYGIHSNNPEIIQILEERKVEFSPTQILEESIKCHHNEISEYIIYNYGETIEKSDIALYAMKYHNYKFYPSEFPSNYAKFFVNACQYNQYFIARDILMRNDDESFYNYTIEVPCEVKSMVNTTEEENYDEYHEKSPFYDCTRWDQSLFESMKSRRIEQRNLMKNKIYKLKGSALNFAVENENINMIYMLLHRCSQIDVNHKIVKYYKNDDKFGRSRYIDAKREEKTPLHIAIEKGNFKIIEMLCKNENIDVNMKTYVAYPSSDGEAREMKTPINIALENNDTSIALYLLHLPNFDVNKLSIDEVWWEGGREVYCEKTPLVLAVEKGDLEICRELLQVCWNRIDVDKRLIEFYTKANLSYINKSKKTPLHIAIRNKDCEIAEELLEHNANIRAFDVKEYRYYHFERSKQLKTPLFLAIEQNDIKMVKLLLSYDDIDIKNGLLNLEGSEYPINSWLDKYHPRIRNDIQKTTDEKKVAYFLRKKGNYTASGYYSESSKRNNDKKYLNMDEEEDFDDDYSFYYSISEKITPIEAAKTIQNDTILHDIECMRSKLHIEEEECNEKNDDDDDEVKMFFCKDYFY